MEIEEFMYPIEITEEALYTSDLKVSFYISGRMRIIEKFIERWLRVTLLNGFGHNGDQLITDRKILVNEEKNTITLYLNFINSNINLLNVLFRVFENLLYKEITYELQRENETIIYNDKHNSKNIYIKKVVIDQSGGYYDK